MKKNSIITFLSLVLVLASCGGSDDNTSNNNSESILGKWNANKIGYIADGVNIPEVDYYGNQPGCNKNYIQFNDTGIANSGQYNSDCSVLIQDGAWSQVGNTLNLDTESTGVPTVWEIMSITSTELKIKGDMTGLEGVEPGVNLFMNLSYVKSE